MATAESQGSAGRKPNVKDVSLRTGMWRKADDMVKLTPHSEGLSSLSEVNHEVVHRNNVFLPGGGLSSWPKWVDPIAARRSCHKLGTIYR
jgi:hypothetical protein